MKRIDRPALDTLVAAARTSPRRRMNQNLHEMSDPIHRLMNAMEPDSYVQPHRHLTPGRRETLLVLAGRGAILCFDDAGQVRDVALLAAGGPDLVAEIDGDEWHSLVALEPGTIFFEVKEEPYVAPAPADVASFAPAPGSAQAGAFLEKMRQAALGAPRRPLPST